MNKKKKLVAFLHHAATCSLYPLETPIKSWFIAKHSKENTLSIMRLALLTGGGHYNCTY